VCAQSPCLRLLDDLDLPATPRALLGFLYDDLQDERQLRQLRSMCQAVPLFRSTCRRSPYAHSQRAMLHQFLIANEQRVSTATQAIFVALRREQAQQEEAHSRRSVCGTWHWLSCESAR